MAQGTLFVGWGSIVAGREKVASKVLGEAMVYLQGLKAAGTIQSVDVVLLEPHGGELEGFVLLKGDKANLAQLRVDDEFVKVIVGVQLVHSKVGVVGGYSGAEMQSLLQVWDQQEDRLL